MKKAKTFRLDSRLSDLLKKLAERDKRSMTNYLETLIQREADKLKAKRARKTRYPGEAGSP